MAEEATAPEADESWEAAAAGDDAAPADDGADGDWAEGEAGDAPAGALGSSAASSERILNQDEIDSLLGFSLDDDAAGGRRFEPATRGAFTVTALDLERAIAKLPEGCRAAFVLHDVEGYEHREITEMLGVSDGTSKSQLHRARMRLRGSLGARRRRVSETA